jgi:hypothetical protein
VGVNLGAQITPRLRARVGYTFLYWSEVSRPGNQIDRALNPTQIPGPTGSPALVGAPRPAPLNSSTSYRAQGLNFGLELRY